MRVLQAEAGKVDLGLLDGFVGAVRVGIEEQIRRIEHPHAATTWQGGRGDVEPVHERRHLAERPVALHVFVNGDPIAAAEVIRRRRRHFVELRADVAVVGHDFQPGGEGVLQILHHPHPAALVEGEVERLFDFRLGGDEVHLQAGVRAEMFDRLGGRQRRRGHHRGAKVAQGFIQALESALEALSVISFLSGGAAAKANAARGKGRPASEETGRNVLRIIVFWLRGGLFPCVCPGK